MNKVCPMRNNEKKGIACQEVLFHFELYLAGKEMFYKERQRMFEQKTGINVSIKSFLQTRVRQRRREAAKDLGDSL